MSPREIRTYRTQAIVIRHMEFGEADRIIKLFTLEKGKITAIAKGIRKIRSRKAGHLEPFTRVDLFLAKGRNMDIITQAETVDAYIGLRDDLQRVAFAAYVMEVLDRFTYEEGQNVGIFKLLANSLSRLETRPNLETVVHYYEVRLLDLLGFRPQLFECVDCGEAIIEQDQFFSPLAGGALCPKCGRLRPEAWAINQDVLRYFRHLQRSKWQQVEHMIIPQQVEEGLADLIEHYLTYLLERKLNTPDFLREVKGKK
ncbi:MAG: DNA repair protein RecO [Chloroflexota bacterium]|nr:DNA repair protein RecO [Chloroflexota bacterium]